MRHLKVWFHYTSHFVASNVGYVNVGQQFSS